MTAPAEEDPAQIARAAFFMLGAVASFSLMAVAGREVSFELDTFEIMMYRSFVGFAVVVGVAATLHRLNEVNTRNMGLQVTRNIFHFAGQNLWFFAISLIPLAQVFALEFTTPLWVLMLSPVMLGERLTRIRVLAALIGFAGILVVARPGPETLNIGTISAASAAIGFAGTVIFTKKLTRTQSLVCILFWMTAWQSLFGLICAGMDGDIALPSPGALPWLTIIALCGLSAHFCITSALAIAPATLVSPVDFMRLPVIAFVGYALYREPIDIFVFLGALMIFGANYLNLWSETRRRRPRPSAP
ncbi:MAG: DMT family transporter [Pseudomonadota bacterium]